MAYCKINTGSVRYTRPTFGRLAQLARAPRLHRGGRGFEPLSAHQGLIQFIPDRKVPYFMGLFLLRQFHILYVVLHTFMAFLVSCSDILKRDGHKIIKKYSSIFSLFGRGAFCIVLTNRDHIEQRVYLYELHRLLLLAPIYDHHQ
jgi:hypothetical protein